MTVTIAAAVLVTALPFSTDGNLRRAFRNLDYQAASILMTTFWVSYWVGQTDRKIHRLLKFHPIHFPRWLGRQQFPRLQPRPEARHLVSRAQQFFITLRLLLPNPFQDLTNGGDCFNRWPILAKQWLNVFRFAFRGLQST